VQIPTTIAQERNPRTLTSVNSFPKSLNILVDIFVSVTFYMEFLIKYIILYQLL